MDSPRKDQGSPVEDEPQITDNGYDNLGSQSHENTRSPGTKGFGLKKWRRIRRDVNNPKESPSASIDNSKILKRVLPANANANANPKANANTNTNAETPKHYPINLPAEASVGSAFDAFPIPDFVIGAVMDSENSEDRSSKSSTAASAPKPHARDKNKLNTTPQNKLATSSQRIVPAKAKLESSKKPRGERLVQIEKDNSQSSIESDSQSSNLFFMQGNNSNTNGKHTGRSGSYDGENSDEGQHSHRNFDDQVHSGYKVEDSHDGSAAEVSWGAYEAKSSNNKHFSANGDPLVASILDLQSVQEALVKEVQKFGEIGTEPILSIEKLMEDSRVAAKLADSIIKDELGSDETTQTTESSLLAKVVSLEKSVKLLECKLDEARNLLVEKESKVAELEAAIESVKSPKEEFSSTVRLQGKNDDGELENELEGLFKQRIEAEIEYMTITRANQSFKVVAETQATIFKEKVSVAEEQVVNKLGDVETKAAKLKKEAHELENYCSDILGTEEVLVTQRRVFKFTGCFFAQLILLVLVLWMFTSELSLNPDPDVVVPT